MTFSVVLVSSDADVHSSMRSLVSEATEIDLVATASTAAELATLLDDSEGVDVVVVDELLADTRGIDLVRQLAQSHPLLATLLVTGDPSPEHMAAAVEAGARGRLVTPVSLQELVSRVDAAASWSRALRSHVRGDGLDVGRRGRVVAVAGAKGGVGATMIAVLLAKQAVIPGRTVCLVDLDLRKGDAGFYCGVTPRRSVADLAEVAADITGRSVREVVQDVVGGFALLASPSEVERAEDVTAVATRQIIGQLRMMFDVVVIDVGATLDDPTAAALEVADDAVLVVSTDVVSLRAARRMLASYERLNVRSTSAVRLVVNHASRHREVQTELAGRVVQIPVAASVPDDFPALEAGLNAGRLLEQSTGSVGQAVGRLARILGLREASTTATTADAALSRRGARPPRSRRRRHSSTDTAAEAGQASIEAPITIAFFVMVFLLCVQALLWGTSVLFAGHAAAEAAREVAVGSSQVEVTNAVRAALPFQWEDGYQLSLPPNRVRITVQTPKVLPWLGDLDMSVTRSSGYVQEPR
jgi:pilus assembly protein CpaE